MPSAPLAATSQSRKKQKTYHNTEKSLFFDENKENHGVPDLPPPLLKTYHSAPVNEEGLPLQVLPFPATPANRIPLDDLVGNTEDAFNRPTVATTPNDCVTWQHGPRSSDPSSSYHTTQRSGKRPRSSSPSSSHLEKSNHLSAQKDSLNMDGMQKSLRTPQNDPSIDLWTRYAGGNVSKSIGHNSALASLAHLLPSSPQTPSTTGSRGKSMRRVVSCGMEWPTTETKKRKTPPKSHARVKDIFAASKRRMFSPELPRSGRVGLLLEKIQESLSTKPVDDVEVDAEGPSSSSPIPLRTVHEQTLPNAPEPLLPRARPVFEREETISTGTTATGLRIPTEESVLHDLSSSDYGGDDIDYDLAEQVEFVATQAIANTTRIQITPWKAEKEPLKYAIKPAAITPSNTNAAVKVPTMAARYANPAPIKPAKMEPELVAVKTVDFSSDDEFGLDDPDFAEELGDLAAKYESQDQQCITVQQSGRVLDQAVKANEKATIILQGGSDEFDDPYDDDVWKDIAYGSIDPQTGGNVGSTSQVCGPR